MVRFSLRLVNSSLVRTTTMRETTKLERKMRAPARILPKMVCTLISPYPAVVNVTIVYHSELLY